MAPSSFDLQTYLTTIARSIFLRVLLMTASEKMKLIKTWPSGYPLCLSRGVTTIHSNITEFKALGEGAAGVDRELKVDQRYIYLWSSAPPEFGCWFGWVCLQCHPLGGVCHGPCCTPGVTRPCRLGVEQVEIFPPRN